MKPKTPIYTLPHGIEVIGEYPRTELNRYARLRIRAHPFFPEVAVKNGGQYVRKSRAVMASKLGRALLPRECVHHLNEDRDDDRPENLEVISPEEHNTHHKTGTKHRAESKKKTSESLKRAYAEGRHVRHRIANRTPEGRIA